MFDTLLRRSCLVGFPFYTYALLGLRANWGARHPDVPPMRRPATYSLGRVS
jgi:hypothetical protein